MLQDPSEDWFRTSLTAAVRNRLDQIAAEEIAKAQASLADRVKAEMDRLALSIASHYSIEHMRDSLVITVNKTGLCQQQR